MEHVTAYLTSFLAKETIMAIDQKTYQNFARINPNTMMQLSRWEVTDNMNCIPKEYCTIHGEIVGTDNGFDGVSYCYYCYPEIKLVLRVQDYARKAIRRIDGRWFYIVQ
jgi:hypothetical protein